MREKIIIIILLFMSYQNYAHKDILVSRKFKNIKVITESSFYFEEINKTFIIGEYASLMCQEMNFKDTITIFFKHRYVDNVNKCDLKRTKKIDKLSFFIDYEKSSFDFKETLNLIEYIIKHRNKTSFNCKIKKVESKNASKLVKEVLSKKVYRPSILPELVIGTDSSYYVKDSKYYIYDFKDDKENIRLSLDKLYQIDYSNESFTVVFDSKKSFYYIKRNSVEKSKIILFDNEDFYMPYKVNSFPDNTFIIELFKLQGLKKDLRYKYNDGEVIVLQ